MSLNFILAPFSSTAHAIVAEEAAAEFDPLELVYPDEIPLFEKYDQYVPAELVRKGFAYGILAVDEMKRRIADWNGNIG